MKKNLPQLAIGRALNRARRAAKKSPRSVSRDEWAALKTMLAGTYGWTYKRVAKEVGRGINTILRVKKSTSYAGYKALLQDEVDMRKNRETGRTPDSQAKLVREDLHAAKVREEQKVRRQERFQEAQYSFFRVMALRSVENEEMIITWLRSIALILIGIFIVMLGFMFKA